MTTSQTNLRVRISADLADIKQGLGLLRGELARVKGQADKALNNTGLLNGLRGMRSAVVGLAGALGAGLSVHGLIAISDEAKTINGRLQLATESQEDFNRAQAETFRIAQSTRNGLKSIADLYARMERSTRDLKLNQATILQLTDTIAKTSAISGGGPGTEAALVQFGQLLSAGDLSAVAQELNSVQEQAPRLAEALKQGLIELGYEGNTSLKKMVSEGGVSLQDLLKALLSQADKVDAEFAQLPETISGGFTRIRNSFLQYTATSADAGSVSATIANALKSIADNLPSLISGFVRLASVIGAYFLVFKVLPGLIAGAIGLGNALRAAGTAGVGALRGITIALAPALALFAGIQIGAWLREEFVEVRVAGIYLAQSLHKVAVSIAHYFTTAGPRIKLAMLEAFNFLIDIADRMNTAIIGVLEKIPGRVGRAYAAMRGKSKAFLEGLRADTAGVAAEVAKLDAELAAKLAEINAGYGDQVNQAYADAAGAGRGSLDTGTGDVAIGGGGNGDKVVAGVINQAELAADKLKRLLEGLEHAFKAREVSVTDYFRLRTSLQLQAVDLEILLAKAEAASAKTTDQRSAALTRAAILERDRAEIATNARREEAEAAKQFHTDEMQRLEEKSQAAQGRLRNAETAIGAQVEAGLLGAQEGERQIRAERARTIEQLLRLRAETLAYYATLNPGSPEAQAALDYLRQLNGGIGEVQASQRELSNAVEDEAVRAFSTLFADITDGVKSAKDAFNDFVGSFLKGIARILQQKAAEKLVDAIFASFNVKHAGGVVGNSGSWTRNVNPLLLGMAPRYHGGGIAGLAPDEVPAILQEGEEVLTKNDPRHRKNLRKVLDKNASLGGIQVNTVVTVEGGAAGGDGAANAQRLGDALEGAVVDVMVKHSRQGGFLWKLQQGRT